MKHLGDVTKINGAEIEPVDIITFGSPCTNISIAGRREGLKGERSVLFMEAIRIIKEMRCNTNRPTFIIFENVIGLFSSNKGEDFRVVLEEITKINQEGVSIPRPAKWLNAGLILGDDFSLAWRVLDSQFWGVPQRRRRIFLVADFAGQRAGEILFKPQSKRWHSSQSRTQGKGTAAKAKGSSDELNTNYLTIWDSQEKRIFTDKGVSPTLTGSDGGGGRTGVGYVWPTTTGSLLARADSSPCADRGQPFVVHQNQLGEVRLGEVANTLNTNSNATGRNSPLVSVPSDVYPNVTETICASGAGLSRPAGMGSETDLCIVYPINDKATRYKGGGPTRNNDGSGNGLGIGDANDPSPTLDTSGRHAVAFENYKFGEYKETDVSSTIKSRDYKDATDLVKQSYAVRRLTALECERLQGFPDGWTEFGHDGKPISDAQRYKALGNSVAIPCVEYIMEGIVEVLK